MPMEFRGGARREHAVTVDDRARLPGSLTAYLLMVIIVFVLYYRIRVRKRFTSRITNAAFSTECKNRVGADGRLHNRRPQNLPPLDEREQSPEAAQEPAPRRNRRMVTMFDIDDTIKSSGNYNIGGFWHFGGVDSQEHTLLPLVYLLSNNRFSAAHTTQYDRGTIYPGVAQFALELSRHELPPGETVASVAVLTARPREFANPGIAFMLTEKSPPCKLFAQCGEENGYPGWGIGIDRGMAMYGSIVEWVLYQRRGRRKFFNFKDILKDHTHPEVGDCERNCYVLIGDTGDKDEECGELLLKYFADDVMGVFLHCVNASPDSTEVPIDVYINNRPICYFRTYPGAARKAYLHGLISIEGMLRVCDAAERALLEQKGSRTYADSRFADLERDMQLCRVLAEHKQETSLKPYQSPGLTHCGSTGDFDGRVASVGSLHSRSASNDYTQRQFDA